MKKFNLFNEIIISNKQSLLEAINKSEIFGINTVGDIVYEPFNNNEIFIYKGKPEIVENFTKVLGNRYQLVEDGDRVLIKAFSNWQELIAVNTPNASYDDTTADGVGEFADKELENIGWHVAEFGVDYRALVEVLEEKCEGTTICIEQEEPYQFSGLGFIADNVHAKEVLFDFCKAKAKDKLDNDEDYEKDSLTDDEEDAAKFFGLL